MSLSHSDYPWLQVPPGSAQELEAFAQLQTKLLPIYEEIFSDRRKPRTVVVVPSLSFDAEELAKITGVYHYEERLLCLLLLLQLPHTHIVYATSQPIQPSIVDYYLHLLPGVPSHHARRRLTLLSCHDASSEPLTQKLLQRPRLLQAIRNKIIALDASHLACFNTTHLERTLAVELGLPLYGCDPALSHLGDKTHSRELFRMAGVPLADGMERLKGEDDIIHSLTVLKTREPSLRRAVIKLNEGFSGEGNAIFSFEGAPEGEALETWVRDQLPKRIRFEAAAETYDHYLQKFKEMEGIVESWIDGDHKRSPSVQCRVSPKGEVQILSTHDQVLGGPSGQIFLGCTFPADKEYRLDLQELGTRIGELLRDRGVLGRFAIDFISVKEEDKWKHYAIEINLRKGGTTLPFLMLEFLINGRYDLESGRYLDPNGQPRYYYASDNLQDMNYRGLTPDDLMDILVDHELYFHSSRQEGVVFHLMGTLSQFGKLGVVCIGNSHERAKELYDETVRVLDHEVRNMRR